MFNTQVKNHGIPEEVVREMLRVAREFFHLPEAERLKCYSDDPSRATRLSTSFNVRTETVSNWRDFLRLHCYPLEDFVREWPCNPPDFKYVPWPVCSVSLKLTTCLVAKPGVICTAPGESVRLFYFMFIFKSL